MRYRCIQREQVAYSLTLLCHVLQVSRSGDDAFVPREGARGLVSGPNHALLADVRCLHRASRRTYGQGRLCEA